MTVGLGQIVEACWARRTAWERAAGTVLGAASWPYAAASGLRNHLYDRGWRAIHRLPARVVSVGNLTVGGSGKTPLSLWLAEHLVASGRRVAIVARGYRKRRRGVVVVGRDGRPLVSTRDGGDEAVLLARRFAGPVVVGEDRVAAARVACAEFGAEIVVLDDGFQHRRLARDLDIVSVTGDPRLQRLLPAGPLREEASALGRAGAVVVMDDPGAWTTAVVPGGVPVVRAQTRASALIGAGAAGWQPGELGALAGREVAVLSGIARPARFVSQLEQLGARVREMRLLDDHHVYDAGDVAWVERAATRGLVVTTEKDLVKLIELMDPLPALALRVAVDVDPADVLVRLAVGEDVLWREARPERR